MKINKKISIFFILLLSLGFSITTITAKSKIIPSGKILSIEGKYAFIKYNNKWRRAKINTAIFKGAQIKTGKSTRLIIRFKDNSELRIAQNSKIKIKKLFVKSPEKRNITFL